MCTETHCLLFLVVLCGAHVYHFQVGDPAAADPRWEAAYELCAQPGAVLDFSNALRAAGHAIPSRYEVIDYAQ